MKMVYFLHEGVTSLDVIGPYQMLSALPDAEVQFVAKAKGVIKDDKGFPTMYAAYSLDEVHSADLLLLPGIRPKLNESPIHEDSEVLDWIRKIHETTRWTTSVCAGSILLGAAGLLQGLKATGHWNTFEILPYFGVTPTAERVVREGKIVTSAGISAGIDMGLRIVAW
jgi:putative intracellular protease/amidase